MQLLLLLQVAVTWSVAHALELKVTPEVVSPNWYTHPKVPPLEGDWYAKPALLPEPVTPYEQKIRSATKWKLDDPRWMIDDVQHESQAEPCDDEPLRKELAASKIENREKTEALSAIIILMFVALMYFFALTQTKRKNVSGNTIIVADNVVSIFIAVLWFNSFEDLAQYHLPTKTLGAHMAHAVFLLGTIFLGAFLLRFQGLLLPIFCASGAKFAQFGGAGASLHYQSSQFADNVALCFAGFFILFAGLLILGVLSFYVKKFLLGVNPGQNTSSHPTLMAHESVCDQLDNVECAVASFSLAVYLNSLLKYVVVGNYGAKNHTSGQRLMMLALAILGLILGFAVIHEIAKMKKSSYFMVRVCAIINAFVVMTCVSLFHDWGKMSFYEAHALEDKTLSQICHTAICTVVGMIGIFFISKFERTTEVNDFVMGAGLLVGMSWHTLFDDSFQALCEFYVLPHHLSQPVFALVLAALIMPVWVTYLKPLSINAAKLPESGGTGFKLHHGIDKHGPDKA